VPNKPEAKLRIDDLLIPLTKLSKTFDPSPVGCGEASIGFPLVSFFCATTGSD